jgi:hypothetical protein
MSCTLDSVAGADIDRADTFDSAAYSGTALAFRDRLVIEWNKTQQRHTFADQKRVYCEEHVKEVDRTIVDDH